MSDSLTIVWERRSTVGEGPIWYQNALYWVDIKQGKVLRCTPATDEKEIWEIGQEVGTVVPRESGGLLLATDEGFMLFNPENGSKEKIDSPPMDLMNGRFNDGKCDPLGHFLAGTISSEKNGGFFRLSSERKWRQLFDSVGCSNGLIWWEDEFYYIDSPTKRVDRFDYDTSSGKISNRRVAFTTEDTPGIPDGMAIDSNGNLWIAFFNGSCVKCFNRKSGKVLEEISLPVPKVTACAFGGDELKDLYITTASAGMDQSQLETYPKSGNLFLCQPGVSGLPANVYKG